MNLINKKICASSWGRRGFVISFVCVFAFYIIPFFLGEKEVFQKPLYILLLVSFLFSYLYANVFAELSQMDRGQLDLLNVLIVVYFSIVIVYLWVTRTYENNWELICNGILWLAGGVPIMLCWKKKKIDWKRLLKTITDNAALIVIVIIAVSLTVSTIDDFFRWDASLYYDVYENMDASAIFHFAEQTSFTHFSNGYSLLVLFFKLLTGNTGVGLRITNIVLYVSAIIAGWFLVPQLAKSTGKIFQVVATCVLAFSPYLLGMVGNISMDYPVACLFLVVCALIYCKYDVWASVAAWLFVFSKEPATCIFLGGMLGYFIKYFIEKGKNGIAERKLLWINSIFLGMTWCTFYVINGGAAYGSSIFSGNGSFNSFGIDIEYIISKIKVLSTLNFNWLMLLICLACLPGFFVKSGKEAVTSILPIVIAGMMSLLFNICFITHNHPRYIAVDSVIIMLVFITLVGFKNSQKGFSILICGSVAILLLLQSYFSVDPISNRGFGGYRIGKKQVLLTVPDGGFCDTSVYNRQYTYLDDAIDVAIQEVLNVSDSPLIIFPSSDKESDGYAWFVGGTWWPEEPVYWDKDNRRRTLEVMDYKLRIEYAESKEELTDMLNEYDDAFFIRIPFLYQEIQPENFEMDRVNEIDYKGWNIEVYK